MEAQNSLFRGSYLVLHERVRANKEATMKPKVQMTKEEQINYWVQQYLQAKTAGDHTKLKMFKAIIEKLGGKVPRL